jgi:hypothetical protein
MSNFQVHEATLWAPEGGGGGGRRVQKASGAEMAVPGQGSNTVYNIFKAAGLGIPTTGSAGASIASQISLTADTIKIALMRSSYTVDAAHDFANDIEADELNQDTTLTGYQAGFAGTGRATLGTKTLVVSTSTGVQTAAFDAADPAAWTISATQTIGGAVIYSHRGSAAVSPLICYLAFTNTPTNGGPVTVSFHSSGILTLS